MSCQTAAGTYQVKWELPEGGMFHQEIEIPFGCSAELTLFHAPENLSGVQVLTAGQYTFSYPLED